MSTVACDEEHFIFGKVNTLVRIDAGETPTRTYIGSDDRVTLWENGTPISFHVKRCRGDVGTMLDAARGSSPERAGGRFEHYTMITGDPQGRGAG